MSAARMIPVPWFAASLSDVATTIVGQRPVLSLRPSLTGASRGCGIQRRKSRHPSGHLAPMRAVREPFP
jgi:hypothetical protein